MFQRHIPSDTDPRVLHVATDDDAPCDAEQAHWLCTRWANHDGSHRAGGFSTDGYPVEVYATWDDDRTTDPTP